MATTITAYNHLSELLANALLDLDGVTIRVALVTSAYSFDATHTAWAQASGSEVATGDGYTTGGQSIAPLSLTRTAAATKLTAASPVWSSLTKTFRRGIAYVEGTINGITNPLLFAILFDDTPADITITALGFVVAWNAAGTVVVGPGTVS